MSGQRHSTSPFSTTSSTTSERSKAEDPSSYECSCGTGDGSGDYIQCDNEKCELSWYHWECVQVTEAPAGTWLCPSCSPSATFYVKQLVTKRAASPVVPKIEMTDEAAGSKTGKQKQKQKPMLEIKEKDVAKKGVAVKKHGEVKPKPKWRGWVELSSDGEQEFKKNVDAQWDVEDDLVGKRRRGSRATIQETELSPRALRARSRPDTPVRRRASLINIPSNDSEEDSEEAPVRRRAPVIYISSDDSEDTMDVDQGPPNIETNNSDDPSPRTGETSPSQPAQAMFASESNTNEKASQPDAEDSTDMEYEDAMEYQDEEPQASRRELAGSQSLPPESSLPAIGHEDAMDVRADDDDDVQEVLLATNQMVDDANLHYQGRSNRWGEFHESAIRSTLPRLG